MKVTFPKVDESKLTSIEKKVLELIRKQPGRNVAIIMSDSGLSVGDAATAISSLYRMGLVSSDKTYSNFYATPSTTESE